METISITWNLMFWLGGLVYIPLLLVSLYFFAKKEFMDMNDKVLWALGVVFLPVIGSLLFLFVGLRRE